jgi:hypothetical protein
MGWLIGALAVLVMGLYIYIWNRHFRDQQGPFW